MREGHKGQTLQGFGDFLVLMRVTVFMRGVIFPVIIFVACATRAVCG